MFTITVKDEYLEFINPGTWLLEGFSDPVGRVWLINAETEEWISIPKHWVVVA